jgi:glycosyltransferase involved in cell wall biosynthesis
VVQGLVSVIIPCFNYGRYLRQCVQSLLRQSYSQWECIIVDDGSTDETPAICTELARTEPRVHVFRQTNAGLSAARNAGIRRAAGEFVQFLDADDLLQPEKLAAHVRFLQSHPSVDIVVGDGAYVDESAMGRPRVWISRQVEGVGAAALPALIDENPFMVHCPLVRNRIFELAGVFNGHLRGHEDWEFWLRCALRGCRFAYFNAGDNGLALVRQHGRNMSAARQMMFDTAVTIREMLQEALPPELRAMNVEGLATMTWRRGLELMRAGSFREGWRMYQSGFRLTRRKGAALLRLLLIIPGLQHASVELRRWKAGGRRLR